MKLFRSLFLFACVALSAQSHGANNKNDHLHVDTSLLVEGIVQMNYDDGTSDLFAVDSQSQSTLIMSNAVARSEVYSCFAKATSRDDDLGGYDCCQKAYNLARKKCRRQKGSFSPSGCSVDYSRLLDRKTCTATVSRGYSY